MVECISKETGSVYQPPVIPQEDNAQNAELAAFVDQAIEDQMNSPAVIVLGNAVLERIDSLDPEVAQVVITNIRSAFLHHQEKLLALIEKMCDNNMRGELLSRTKVYKLMDELETSGDIHGWLKMGLGVIGAVPVIFTSVYNNPIFGVEAEQTRKIGESVTYMIRSFSEGATTFMQSSQEGKKTIQRMDLEEVSNTQGKRRSLLESETEDARQTNRAIETYYQGFKS